LNNKKVICCYMILDCLSFSYISALNTLNSSFRSLNSCLNESISSLLAAAVLVVVVVFGADALVVGEP